jgi:hypothetical protein
MQLARRQETPPKSVDGRDPAEPARINDHKLVTDHWASGQRVRPHGCYFAVHNKRREEIE